MAKRMLTATEAQAEIERRAALGDQAARFVLHVRQVQEGTRAPRVNAAYGLTQEWERRTGGRVAQ
jgi:hypothetical protein